ncbi:hypothetical protein BDZ89DRAFT_144171 [Hymenopellis radicata]|nr:hypothetical protein BDZ89DRAFT_144171 [Hymenopellis radicata]
MSTSSESKAFTTVLPLELWQEVIDLIADMEPEVRGQRSSGSLEICALTCKAWLWHVRPYLHKTISIRSLHQAERFLRCISSSSPSIAPYVKALEFHDTRTGNEQPYVRKVLPDFARALPDVKLLALSNIDNTSSPRTTRLALQDGFREVTHLMVQRGRFTDSKDLIGLLSSLPQLQSLELLNVVVLASERTLSHCAITSPCVFAPWTLTCSTRLRM